MASVGLRECPVEPGFDPLSPEFLADPFTVMVSLHLEERPVFYAPAIDYYVITHYRDIESIFSDHESYSAAAAQLPLVELDPEARQILLDGGHRPQPSMVSLDPPAHTRLRRPTAPAFSARRTAEMEPRIRAVVDELLGAIDAAEPFDLVSALTFPLPATVVFSFVGVPEEDYTQLKLWCGYRAKLAWGRPLAEEQIEHATNMTAYRRYLRELVASKDQERGDDFTSALLAIHDEDPGQNSKLFLWLAAAGRDPTVFTNPNTFDLRRANAKRHLAFGKGIHFCIGSALGKLEARLALEALTTRFRTLRLVPEQTLSFHPNISFRGPQALWAHAS